jgi:hypothetical protein
LCNLLNTLLLLPDNPEQGVLALLTGVLNLINEHIEWENLEFKFSLLADFCVILSAMKQETFLYHVHNVESNDTLYGSDVKFLKEVNKLIASVMNDIFKLLVNFVSFYNFNNSNNQNR